MDFESFGNLSIDEINNISSVFLSTLQSMTNSQPIIYSDAFAAQTVFSSTLVEYPLWVANYGVSEPESNR